MGFFLKSNNKGMAGTFSNCKVCKAYVKIERHRRGMGWIQDEDDGSKLLFLLHLLGKLGFGLYLVA